MNMMSERPLPASAIEQVVNEVLIRELTRIIHEAEGSLARSREEAEAMLARMETERCVLKDEAARRDYLRAKEPPAEALQTLGFHPSQEPEIRQRLYARSFAAIRQLNQFERRLEEGDSVEERADQAEVPSKIVTEARLSGDGTRRYCRGRVHALIEKKYAGSRDNQNHARAAKRVALDFWGNVPQSSLTEDDFVALLLFMRRLPVPHGRNHGNNRYVKGRSILNKRLEVEIADAADNDLRKTVERLDLSEREKQAMIRAGLIPRLSVKTLKKHHSFVRAASIAAKDHLGFGGSVMPVVFSTFQARAKVIAEKEAAVGQTLLQRRRRRLSWSDERLTALHRLPAETAPREG